MEPVSNWTLFRKERVMDKGKRDHSYDTTIMNRFFEHVFYKDSRGTVTFLARFGGHHSPENVEKAQTFIREAFREAGLEPKKLSNQYDCDMGGPDVTVYAEFDPSTPAEKAKEVAALVTKKISAAKLTF